MLIAASRKTHLRSCAFSLQQFATRWPHEFERQSALTQVLSTVKLNFPPLNQHHVTSGILFAISLGNPKGNFRHCPLTLSHSRHSLYLRARQISSTGFLWNKLTWMSLRTANQMLHRSLSTPALSRIWKQHQLLCSRFFPRWRHTKRVASITFQPDSWSTVQSTSLIVSRVYSIAVLSWVNFPQLGKKPWWYQYTKKEAWPTQETTDRLHFYLSSARLLNASFMTNSLHSYSLGYMTSNVDSRRVTEQSLSYWDSAKIGTSRLTAHLTLELSFSTWKRRSIEFGMMASWSRWKQLVFAAQRWLGSGVFLSLRRQITMIEGFSSSSLEIRAGVPQGAILSPLLFSIYVNDIVSAAPLCNTNLFADDTSAYVSSPCPTLLNTSLQSAADSLSDWFGRWHVSIHPSKTVCMALRSRGMPPCPLYIYINGKRIAQVTQHCHLGVIFNDTLSWKDHVHKIVLQFARKNGLLRRLGRHLSPTVLRDICLFCIRSGVEYSSVVWSGLTSSDAVRLERNNRSAARLILKN